MKMKRVLGVILVLTMCLTLFAGCADKKAGDSTTDKTSQASEASKSTEAKGTTVGGSIKILSNVTGGKDEEEMVKFEEALSKATGLKVDVEIPSGDYSDVLMQKLQSGEKYDLISLGMDNYLSLIEQDSLLDITDFMKSSKIFSDPAAISPQEIKDIEVDGKIYAGFNKKEIHKLPILNKVHLNTAGINYKEIEPTLDGYYNVFKKLKAAIKTPNYYPYNCVMGTLNDLQPWFASAGIKLGVVLDKDGKKYAPISTDAAIPVFEWIAKLYKEGLMDPAAAVDETKVLRSKISAASQLSSVVVDWAAFVGIHNSNALAENIGSDKYELVSLPGAKTPDGSYMLTKGGPSLWAIPIDTKNPEGAKKIIEYFATQEGGELLSVGINGYDYNIENGKYVLTDIGKKHANDHGAPVPILESFKFPVGLNPGMEEALSYGKYASIKMAISNSSDCDEIGGKWAIQIMKGSVTAADGVASMRKEFLSRGVTEKEVR